jgi:hypothetical protein
MRATSGGSRARLRRRRVIQVVWLALGRSMTTRDRTRTNTHHARTHMRDRPSATLRPANWLALAPDCVGALWAPQRPPELLRPVSLPAAPQLVLLPRPLPSFGGRVRSSNQLSSLKQFRKSGRGNVRQSRVDDIGRSGMNDASPSRGPSRRPRRQRCRTPRVVTLIRRLLSVC